MSEYKRLTSGGSEYCTNDGEHDIIIELNESRYEYPQYDYVDICKKLNRLCELEDKIENADKVEIYYKPPFETKYAIIKYYARQGKPLKVAEYNIYGEELKTGKQLIYWEYISSTNFSVIENGFNTKAEAEARLKELKRKVC